MLVAGRRLMVVGDRLLVRPEDGESMTNAGLILPASVADREEVQTGRVLVVGPGMALAPSGLDLESESARPEPRWVPMQARPGDLVVFSRKASIDVIVDGERLVVVPHGGLLLILRSELERAQETVN